jgi:hypothetical protein
VWTPAIGDVLLYLWADPSTVTQWTGGTVYFAQNVNTNGVPNDAPDNIFARMGHGEIGVGPGGPIPFPSVGDSIIGSSLSDRVDVGTTTYIGPYVFHSTDPFQVMHVGDATAAGYVEVYAQIAHAAAP